MPTQREPIEEKLQRIEGYMDAGENIDHDEIRELLDEVRRLQALLHESTPVRRILDDGSKACPHGKRTVDCGWCIAEGL